PHHAHPPEAGSARPRPGGRARTRDRTLRSRGRPGWPLGHYVADRLAPSELLGRLRLELERHNALVADGPRIVTRLDHVCLARIHVLLRAVFVNDVHPARLEYPEVPGLAAFGSRHRLDALGPSPAGLEGHAGNGRPAHPDHVDPRLVRRP